MFCLGHVKFGGAYLTSRGNVSSSFNMNPDFKEEIQSKHINSTYNDWITLKTYLIILWECYAGILCLPLTNLPDVL